MNQHDDLSTTRRPATSARGEQRVRDILRVAREVFAERGYEHATTLEVAQRLGISEATVFTYFRGKRALCERVIGDWYDEIITTQVEGLPRNGTLRAQLRYLIHTHLRLFLIQGTGLCALVLSEGRTRSPQDEGQPAGAEPDPGLGGLFQPLQRRYTAPLMEVLARGQTSGELRADVPLRLMRALVLGPMEHLLWEAIGQGRPVDVDSSTDALMDLLWAALAAPDVEQARLQQFKRDVGAALARLD